MTHRILFAASALAVLATAASALAQDDDKRWTGWYAGVNLGAAWGNTSHRFLVAPGNGTVSLPALNNGQIALVGNGNSNPTGFTGGGEAGYNWSHKYSSGYFVYGLETDFDYMDLKQSRTGTFAAALMVNPLITPATQVTATIGQQTKSDWLWTIRPRIGYATGSWLFYATGGLAVSDIKLTTAYTDTFLTTPYSAHTSSTRAGWTAGAGIAYAFANNWSVKAEYLYADFGNVSQTAVVPNGYGSIISETSAKTNIARLGFDYRF